MDKNREKYGRASMDGARQNFAKSPELDLHGLYSGQVLDKVDVFIYDQYNKKLSEVKIVYGIGEGVLRKKVLDYVKAHPLVSRVEEEIGRCKVILDI